MDGDIRYNGKMTDKLPAWALVTAANYGLHPKQYTKVHNYLNENYPRRKVKVDSVEIISIKETESMKGVENGTVIVRCYGGPGTIYDYKVRTYVEVGGDYFAVIQEGKLQVSESVGQVLSNNMKWLDNEGNIVVEV